MYCSKYVTWLDFCLAMLDYVFKFPGKRRSIYNKIRIRKSNYETKTFWFL